jgi:hypothetical protein
MAALALVGCASPVLIQPPAAPPAGCGPLLESFPSRVAGQEQRTTEPQSPATAAWGDPPISVVCGVGVPTAYQPTSQLLSVNGVDWLAEQLESGFRFTTIGQPVNVEVTVPAAYAPEADVLAQVSLPISRATPPATLP